MSTPQGPDEVLPVHDSSSRSSWRRAGVLGYLLLLASFGFLAVNGLLLVRSARQLHHGALMQVDEWRRSPRVTIGEQGSARVFQPLMVPGPDYPGVRTQGTEMKGEIPWRQGGYALVIGAAPQEKSTPVLIRVLLGGVEISRLDLQPPRLGFGSLSIADIRIPESSLPAGGSSVLQVLTVAGDQWRGNLVLVPEPARFDAARVLIPVVGALLLALGPFALGARRQRWLYLLAPGTLFVVYGFTFFPWTIAPTDGLLFGDSWSYATGSLGWSGTSYIDRHPLFLPVMRRIVMVLARIPIGEIALLQLAFGLVAATNGLLAFLVFRRWLGDTATAAALLVVYAFSFAVWAYSSMYESYIFTAAAVNLFLLLLPRWDRPAPAPREFGAAAAVVAAALAFPPLLALDGVLLGRLALLAPRRPRRLGVPLLALVAGPFAFLAFQTLLRAMFATTAAASPAARAGVLGDNLAVVGQYAKAGYLTPGQFANVVVSQFFYAFGGIPYPLDWSLRVQGMAEYASSIPGAAFVVAWSVLLAGAALGTLRQPSLRARTLLVGVLAFLPYLAFLWYFNPSEVLLYSAPLASTILLGIALAWRSWLSQQRLRLLLLALAALTLANNLWAVTSFV